MTAALTLVAEHGSLKCRAARPASTLMNPRRHIEMMRRVATIAAIILLLGQTIAAAHFHPVSSQHGVVVERGRWHRR